MNYLSANQIELPNLREDSIPRRGDGSFENKLQAAEKTLQEKEKKLLITPWSQIEKLFNIYELEFDFNFKTPKIDQNITQNKEPEYPARETPDQKPNNPKENINGLVYEFKNTEVLKNILKKNLSLSPIPYTLSPFFLSGTYLNSRMLSKTDLQLVIDEIVKQARLIKTSEKTELSFNLSTKELGDLLLSLAYNNGLLLIQIAANPEAKKLIEEHLDELTLALKQSNIDLEDIQIKEVNYGESRKFYG